MNIIKNSSVAFAVSISELTMFAMQAGEETSRNIEMYLAVTGLYFVSAFAINRVAVAVESRVRVPGMIGGK
jgi:glutamate/aspartate transport system permease protein